MIRAKSAARPAASSRSPSPGTTTSDMYGTRPSSTSAAGMTSCPVPEARSTYTARSSMPACRSASRTPEKVRPSFMMIAASVSARRRASSGTESVPGSTVSVSSWRHSPVATAAVAADSEVMPGTTSVW